VLALFSKRSSGCRQGDRAGRFAVAERGEGTWDAASTLEKTRYVLGSDDAPRKKFVDRGVDDALGGQPGGKRVEGKGCLLYSKGGAADPEEKGRAASVTSCREGTHVIFISWGKRPLMDFALRKKGKRRSSAIAKTGTNFRFPHHTGAPQEKGGKTLQWWVRRGEVRPAPAH